MIHNFLFHRVNPSRERLWDPMDVRLFDRCIRHIGNNYSIVLFEDIALTDELFSIKHKYATIMFDDGYKDNIQYALPILEQHGVKASFYVVTDCINRNTPTWTYLLDYSFINTNIKVIELDFGFLPKNLRSGKLLSSKEGLAFVYRLKPLLKTLSHDQRQVVLEKVRETFSDVELPKLMMDWNDLRSIRQSGHYIGSHTKTHAMLGSIEDTTVIKEELERSACDINLNLGYFPISISYPVGSYNATTKLLSQECGYKIGLAVKQSPFDPMKCDLFEVPRIELYNESWFKTRLRISNVLERFKSSIGYR